MGLREELIKQGVWEVVVEYAASWDDVHYLDTTFKTSAGTNIPIDADDPSVRQLTDELLEGLPDDFASEEGSYGDIFFSILDKEIQYNYHENFQDTEGEGGSFLIDDDLDDEEEKEKEGEEPSLLTDLKEVGASKVIVEYNGGGDSGSIESVEFFTENGTPLPDSPKLKEIEARVYNFAVDVALGEIDWYNNEGGFGVVTLDVAANEATLEHNYRIDGSRPMPFVKAKAEIFGDENDDE